MEKEGKMEKQKLGEFELNKIYCMDCLEGLKKIPDNSVDLVVTDPPYGINADKGVGGFGLSPKKARKYNEEWDSKTPSKDIFDEILRVGKKVIIFGGNFFTDKLPINKCWLVWDKIGEYKFDNPYSQVELIWTNLTHSSKKYVCIQQGFIAEENHRFHRFHPTQKPIKLIREIIKDEIGDGKLVVDFFGGSGSVALACKQLGLNYILFEINPEYVKIANKRLAQEVLI